MSVAHANRVIPQSALLVALLLLTGAAAAATLELGWGALAIPLLALAVVLAIAAPHDLALILLGLTIVLEPGAIDGSGRLARLLYELPPGVVVPFTVSPLEIAITIACVSALLRGKRNEFPRLPILAAAVPLAVASGFVHGWRMGGEMNLAYNEGRGLIFGAGVFVLAASCPASRLPALRTVVLISTAALSAIVLYRYFVFVKPGNLETALEFAFAHEDSMLLGVGLVTGLTYLTRPSLSARDRVLLLMYVVLVALALAATQRRAATLVGLVGASTVAALVFTRRPAFIVATGTPLLLLFGAYLGMYWDREYGTTSQPARAVRSQIDPTPRDESSDLYRQIERSNVIETVRLNRLQGVGFGRPFAQFQALPNLESFWPLQTYTPHQNILWLWLKLGIVGMAAFLGFISIGLGRCLAAARQSAGLDGQFTFAVVVAATLLMYLAFATVDLALIGTRGAMPLAIGLALAFRMPRGSGGLEGGRDA